MAAPVGHLLLNEILPDGYRVHGPVTNRQLHDSLAKLAKSDPTQYVDVISRLKRRGDEIATLEGVSVGLDDITPEYEKRDAIVNDVSAAIRHVTDPAERQRLVVAAQDKLLELTKEHPGSMTHMARSGARGNIPQLMKIVATPLAANEERKGINPFLIRHSYAEGLTPAEYWITTPEARQNNVNTVVAVAKPGETNKVLIANMIGKVVTETDCGTRAGVHLRLDDINVLDRYLADTQHGVERNTLVTPSLVQTLKRNGVAELLVRSPMTCAATRGVCQHCMGRDEKGNLHAIGINVGVRSAQALSEPLTQMALGSKHATLVIRERRPELSGFKGVRQLFEVPKVFQHEAVLAPEAGAVSGISAAPQGGTYITVGRQQLYAKPELTATVRPGQHVEAGDALTNGVPHPAKVVQYKGLGTGRQYFVDALHRVYAGEGINLDKRHFELIAKTNLNHVRLLDHDPEHPELLKGEVIDYNAFRDAYAKETQRKPLNEAIGERLGEDTHHYTVGTLITAALANQLHARGVTTVQVAKRLPRVESIMRNFAMTPLLDHDVFGRLSHRYLKDTIQASAHVGASGDIHGTNPIGAYAYGAEMRQSPDGTY